MWKGSKRKADFINVAKNVLYKVMTNDCKQE